MKIFCIQVTFCLLNLGCAIWNFCFFAYGGWTISLALGVFSTFVAILCGFGARDIYRRMKNKE